MPAESRPLRLARTALGPTDDQYLALRDFVAETARPASRLLDVGAGDGDDGYAALIRPLVGELVGVDPEPGIEQNTALDRRYAMTVERFAAEAPEGRFDLALAVYVVEHVADPAGFLAAVAALLAPGGSLFLVTPNLWHYFGLLAKATGALGIEDRLLRLARRTHPGHDHVGHFPVAYRLNSVAELERRGAEAGFVAGEIRFLDNPAVFEGYFPPSLAVLPRSYSRAVHRLGAAALYGTILCRLVMPAGGGAD